MDTLRRYAAYLGAIDPQNYGGSTLVEWDNICRREWSEAPALDEHGNPTKLSDLIEKQVKGQWSRVDFERKADAEKKRHIINTPTSSERKFSPKRGWYNKTDAQPKHYRNRI